MPPLQFQFDQNFSTCENGEPSRKVGFSAPPISATNSDTESNRIQRLYTVWGHACAAVQLLSNRYQNHWQGAIVEMSDCKGTLEVTWRDEQSRVMFEGVIMGAWERECEHAGAHRLASGEIVRV